MNNRTYLFGVLPRDCLLGSVLLILSYYSFSQDQKKVVPDGTMGEVIPVLDSTNAKEKKDRWRLFNGRYTTFKFGGGFLYEMAAYSQDDNSRKQMDSLGTPLGTKFKVRDFRVIASGQLKTKRVITWKVGLMYDGVSEKWLVRETGVMVNVPELWGNIFIGRTKEGFSLNKVMNGYAGWTMERQIAIEVIPILADGIKWLGFLPKQRIFWNVGVFADWLSKDQGFSTFGSQFIARFGWLPIYEKSAKKLLHVGFNYRYGRPEDGMIQVRSRPEANPAPYFIDTKKFPSDHSNSFGPEIYFTSGPLQIGSEYYFHAFNSPQNGNPVFKGGEVGISYIFTGESRSYTTVTSIYGFVPVKKSLFNGGLGALEGVIRISNLDLDDGAIHGGKLWRLTPMVNWYMSQSIRLELAYGYGVLDRFQMKGVTQFFQSRIQIAIL